jgi:hypothetical protein
VSPVKYELGFYIPEDGILYSHRRGNLKSYVTFLVSCFSIRLFSSSSHHVSLNFVLEHSLSSALPPVAHRVGGRSRRFAVKRTVKSSRESSLVSDLYIILKHKKLRGP